MGHLVCIRLIQFVFKEQCLILLHKQWVSMKSSDLNSVLLMCWLHLLLYHGNTCGHSCPSSSFYFSSSLLLSSPHLQCFKNKQSLLFFRNSMTSWQTMWTALSYSCVCVCAAALDTCDVTWLSKRGTGPLREQTLMNVNSGLNTGWHKTTPTERQHPSLYL